MIIVVRQFVKEKKFIGFLFAVIVLIQTICIISFGIQKKGYHIDEIYSYILSNSYSADRISNDNSVWNHWIEGDEFSKFITVNEDETFSYDKVYLNNTTDAHPPLFYYLLHTVCSFFPNTFSKWYGLSINIVFFILIQIVLYRFSKDLFGDSIWCLLPVAIYGGMKAAFDPVLFIRMYVMLAFFTIFLAYFHYKMIKRKIKPLDYCICYLVTFLGTYTQYLFAVFAFFTAAFFCFYLLSKKQWKQMILYSFSMLAAIATVFILYPAAIAQITGSSTNNIGNEVAGNILDFSGWFSSIKELAYQAVAGAFIGLWHAKVYVAIIFVVYIVWAIFYKIHSHSKKEDLPAQKKSTNAESSLLFIGCLLFIMTFVTIAHVVGKFVYVRYIYNLFPVIAILGTLAVRQICSLVKIPSKQFAIAAICVWCISLISLLLYQDNSYLFINRYNTNQEIIEACETRPLIAVGNNSTAFPTGNLTILNSCKNVYLSSEDIADSMNDILSQVDTSNGVVFMILTDQYWTEGYNGEERMDQYVQLSDSIHEYKEIGPGTLATVYLAN